MEHNLTILLSGKPLTEAQTDDAITALPGYSAAISETAGHPEIVITLEAADLRQAILSGLAVVEHATGRTATAVEAMSTADYDRRNGLIPIPDLVSAQDAAAILGVSRQAVVKMHDTGRLVGELVGRQLVFARADVEAAAAKRASS